MLWCIKTIVMQIQNKKEHIDDLYNYNEVVLEKLVR